MMRVAVVLVAALALGACATTPRPGTLSPELLARWQARQAEVADIDHFDIKGRMAVRTADDGGSATFIWEREGDDHRIEMFGPFGSGRVTIVERDGTATLRDGDDNTDSAGNAETLLYRRVGWHVPFRSLNYWLKGVPSPAPYSALSLDESGRAIGFDQDGWQVSILDYAAGEPAMPRRVFLSALPGTVHLVGEEGEDLGDRLDVKVVLRRWQVLPGPG